MFEDAIGSEPLIGSPPETYLFEIGQEIDNQYQVLGYLGQGGMGAVLRVQHWFTEENLALKYCTRDGDEQRRFAREVRAMERVESPHVVKIVDFNLDHIPPYFVMPLATRSLQDEMILYKGDVIKTLDTFSQMCEGIWALHSTGIFHRDIKPANVLIMPGGKAAVSDLGLVRFEHRDTTILTRTIHQLGTEDYLAPEQKLPNGSRHADARTDIYQLGKVLYQMLTGKSPKWVDVSALPPGLDHIVRRATAENPQERYPDIPSFARTLSGYVRSLDVTENPREVLTHILARIRDEKGKVASETITEIAHTLIHACTLDFGQYLECFCQIPVELVVQIGQEVPSDFLPALRTYVEALDETAGRHAYPFADDVADVMGKVYDRCGDIRLRVLALRAIMTAAEQLSRHAPQRLFCRYLERVATFDVALPISEMLAEYGVAGIKRFQGFNYSRYHFMIRQSLDEIDLRDM